MISTPSRQLWNDNWRQDEENLDACAARIRAKRLDGPVFQRLSPRWPDLRGVRVCELGAGMGRTGLGMAVLGADVTFVDVSEVALAKVAALADRLAVRVHCRQEDVFNQPADLRDCFDVVVSLGLAEHFTGPLRHQVLAAHVAALRPEGTALILVPNADCMFYRLWKAVAEAGGWWSVGFEEAFTRAELLRVAATLPVSEAEVFGSGFTYALERFFLHKLYWGLRNLVRHGTVRGLGDRLHIPSWLRLPRLRGVFDERWGYSLSLYLRKADPCHMSPQSAELTRPL